MIKYLKYKDIDVKKYDSCIAKAIQSKVYAYSWFLDIVSDNWNLLVLDDYKAVMPLPTRKKYGLNYVFQPNWIQHLGLFSLETLSFNDIENFIKHIPKKFKLLNFNVNFKIKNSHTLTNYVLPLNKDYKTLFKAFSKGRKSSINQAQKGGVEIRSSQDYMSIITLFREHKGLNLNLTDKAYFY